VPDYFDELLERIRDIRASEKRMYLKVRDIKEFQRLKDEEARSQALEWNFQRTLAKVNYKIHTDAIKERLIPPRWNRLKDFTRLPVKTAFLLLIWLSMQWTKVMLNN
jgi:hypothetical protein